MIKAYKYRLYPSRTETDILASILEVCRRLYNTTLSERKEAYEWNGTRVSKWDQGRWLTKKRTVDPWCAGINYSVLRDVIRRVDKAYQAFFRRMKAKEKPGYPRFKGHGHYDSFTFGAYGNGCKVRDGRLYMQGIGLVKIRLHRPIEGKPKTVTIRRQADGWYACFASEVEPKRLPATGKAVGIDVGLKSFLATTDGELVAAPQYLRVAERKLKQAQRRVSRRKRGSNRRRKAAHLLALAHLHVRNQRHDFHHKVARSTVNRYDLIAVEDLRIQNMVKNRYLAKSISDAGWSSFLSILASKAEEAGRQMVWVNPRGTSQVCSECGVIVPKTLSVRRHRCPDCGADLDRDVNAARNILSAALKTAA